MNSTRRCRISETALLARLAPLMNFVPSQRYRWGIGDDAVVRQCSHGERLILTTDILVENIDFSLKYMTMRDVGFKAIGVNVSDCAAMGALPDSALVAVTFPSRCGRLFERMIELYRGIYRACRRWRVSVVGGDLSAGPGWSLGVTLIGRMVAGSRILRRGGAVVGDGVWVSGTPGDSAAGLAALRRLGHRRAASAYPRLVNRHISPIARLELGVALAKIPSVHAAIDVSDGVSKECHALAQAARVGILLEAGSFPLSVEAQKCAFRLGHNAIEWFLHGGEDFELLFTAAASFDHRIVQAKCCSRLTKIGTVIRQRGVFIRCEGGNIRPVPDRSWDHTRAVR